MTIYRKGLSLACPSRNAVSNPIDLAGRFSFQPYSEDTDEDDNSGANRRALHDKRLLEELYELLATHNQLETSELSLFAHNGVVTIDGTVNDQMMRARIGHLVRHCACVKNVVNRLQTRETGDIQEAWQIDSVGDADRNTSGAMAA